MIYVRECVYGVRKCSSFILLQVVDQFSQHHLLKVVFFLLYILAPCVKDRYVDLSLGFLLCSIVDQLSLKGLIKTSFLSSGEGGDTEP